MIFIAIVGKYQVYSTVKLFLGGQSLSYLQHDCGGSELASKQFVFFADDFCGRIVHYKWNYICIP